MKTIITQISKMKLSSFVLVGTITGAITILFAFAPLQQSKEWTAPDVAIKKANPVASDAKSLEAGKKSYDKNCADCHGKKGKGDGKKAAELDKAPNDFSKEDVQKQTDGSLFWKITEGKKPMPGFKKDMEDTERWQLVNYIRTFDESKKK